MTKLSSVLLALPQTYRDSSETSVEKAEEGQDVNSALFWSERALEEKGNKENAQLLEELRMKLTEFPCVNSVCNTFK